MSESPGGSSGAVALIGGRYELVREVDVQGDLVSWEGFDPWLDRRVLVQLLRQELIDDHLSTERFWQAARATAHSQAMAGERILDAGTDTETSRAFVVREWPERATAVDQRTVVMQTPARVVKRVGQFRVNSRHIVLASLLVVAILGVSAARSVAAGWLAWVNEPVGLVSSASQLVRAPTPPAASAQQAVPTLTGSSAPVVSTPAAKPTAPRAPTRVATPQPAPTTSTARRIVNTDGQGVALRDGPGGARLAGKGYDEGVTVQALESSGEWTRIRGSDGREGWVLSVTLAP